MTGKMSRAKNITIIKIAVFYSLVGLIGICIAFHPSLLSGFSKFQGGEGDPLFVNYVLEHSFQCIFNRDYRASLWTPAFFFPFQNTLALSENLWGAAPLYWIARVFFSPDVAYQVWTITCAFLCFLCFAVFLRSLRVSHILAATGGFIFGFGLVRIGRLWHSQLLPQFFTPLAFLLLWKFLRKPTPNRLRFALAFIFLQVLSSIYLGWFLLLSLLIFVPLFFCFDRASFKTVIQFVQANWKSTIVTVSVWFASLFFVLSPYLQMSKLLGARSFSEVETMLPRLASWVYPFPSTLWHSSLSPLSDHVPMPHEHCIFMGFTVFTLIGFALYSLTFKQKMLGNERATLAKASLTTALIIVGLSLYLAPHLSLWRLVYDIVPGATSIRAVSRIVLFVQFFVLVAGLLCLDSVLKRSLIQPRVATTIALLIFLMSLPENLIFEPHFSVKAPLLKTEAELGELMSQGCDMAYVNLTSTTSVNQQTLAVTQQILAMWAGLKTGVPVVNGYSGSQPPTMPGSVTVTLAFSDVMQWLQSAKHPPTGRFCLIAATDDPITSKRQLEAGISLDSLGSSTQYFSHDGHYTAFVVSLPPTTPLSTYAHGIRAAEQPTAMTAGQSIMLPVFVRNISQVTWLQTTKTPIKFSYRWVSAAGIADAGDGVRTDLPTVAPGKAIALNATIKAPERPGQYLLRLSLVHDGVAWFMDQGAKSLDLPITVSRSSGGKLNGKPKP